MLAGTDEADPDAPTVAPLAALLAPADVALLAGGIFFVLPAEPPVIAVRVLFLFHLQRLTQKLYPSSHCLKQATRASLSWGSVQQCRQHTLATSAQC